MSKSKSEGIYFGMEVASPLENWDLSSQSLIKTVQIWKEMLS